jgi:hypothetical protein
MHGIVMLSVIMLNVVMLSVLVQFKLPNNFLIPVSLCLDIEMVVFMTLV